MIFNLVVHVDWPGAIGSSPARVVLCFDFFVTRVWRGAVSTAVTLRGIRISAVLLIAPLPNGMRLGGLVRVGLCG